MAQRCGKEILSAFFENKQRFSAEEYTLFVYMKKLQYFSGVVCPIA